ncbi:MAG: ATP-grasp domain-containing protein [Vicinamibacterales bacterium]
MPAGVAGVKTVLVTDGDQRSALAAVRALGRAGYRVVVGESRERSLASCSKYCWKPAYYPSPYESEARFVDAIVDAARQHGVDLVLPMTDITSAILADRRDALPASTRLAAPDADTFWRASDKIALHALAASLGVPSPTTHVVNPPVLPHTLDDVRYPCIVKPGRSRLKTPSGWVKTAVSRVTSREELERLIASSPELAYPFMLQRQIDGDGLGVFALCRSGEPLMLFAHRRLREKPPWGGVSVLREAVPVDPVAGAHAYALLKALKWHGVAMVEFKRDDATGVPYLMEINGRFWGSLQLAIDAGLDFPVALANLWLDRPLPPIGQYRTGVKSRWLLGDLDHLLMRLTNPHMALHEAPSLPALVWDFCHFFRRDTHFEVESLSDPGPSRCEMRAYARALIGKDGH